MLVLVWTILECAYCYSQLRDEKVNLICILGDMNMKIGDSVICFREKDKNFRKHLSARSIYPIVHYTAGNINKMQLYISTWITLKNMMMNEN